MRGGNVLLSLTVAMILLAEAMVAVVLSRNWRLSWWEWHLLMLAAFVAIALGARSEYRRSGTLAGAFGGLYLEATLARLDRWHAGAIAAVAAAEERAARPTRCSPACAAKAPPTTTSPCSSKPPVRCAGWTRPSGPTCRASIAEGSAASAAVGRLGGQERVVSVLFADLAGFTTFSETRSPTEVLSMLNEQWAVVVPGIDRAGGIIEHFAGDGVMAIFNADGSQPDHAQRAARAAAAIVGRRRRRSSRTTRAGRCSASASTPDRRWSAPSAPRSGAASRRSVTRSTRRRG